MSGNDKTEGRSAPRLWVVERLDKADLREATALLRQAQELSGLAFRFFDIEADRLLVSANFDEVFGFPPPRCGDEFGSHVHPGDKEIFERWRKSAFLTVGRVTGMWRVVPPEGPQRWIESIAETLPGPTGKPARILMTSRNVTRYRNLGLELATRSSQLQLVQSAALIGTWETDFATGEERWSPEAWALIEPGGIGDANVERFMAAVHPDDRDQVWRRVEEAMETGHYLDEFRVVHPDGSVHWLKGIATAGQNDAGQGTLMRGVVIDVTERKQIEAATSRMIDIIEAMPDFVSGCDLDGRIIYANPTARRMMGIGADEPVADLKVVEFMLPKDRDRLPEIFEAVARDGNWRGEMDMLSRDGSRIPTSIVCVLHRDASGKPLYMSAIARDVTKERAATQALQEADRRKDVFLATLAHELRNPLAPLRSMSDALGLMEVDDPRLGTVRRVVEQQTAYLTRLIEDLLDVSRLANGKLTLRTAPASIAEAIGAAAEQVSGEIVARGHQLEIALPEEELVVDGDMLRLTQVVANLLGNSAKYTNTGGQIRVGARRDGAAAVIVVEDNGIGIADDFLPKLFDAFAQAPDQKAKGGGGLGLGLMLVKQIVELHGGTVVASSAGVGLGSRFEVRLPLAVAASGPATADEAPASGLSLRGVGRKVLIVDDYEGIRESLELLLTMHGFIVETAADGKTALTKAATFDPDVALIDMNLPTMNGPEIAQALRRLPRGGEIRLLAMSGIGSEDHKRKAIAAGFGELLTKPIGIERLMALLSEAAPGRAQEVA